VALVTGIVSLVCFQPAGVVAVIFGRRSVKRIDASMGELGGRGMAVAGIVLGVIALVLFVFGLIVLIANH
jgi:hypothetical protein